MEDADLCDASLSGADRSEAFLGGVHLQDADMGGARVTLEHLAQVKSLQDAPMPDVSINP